MDQAMASIVGVLATGGTDQRGLAIMSAGTEQKEPELDGLAKESLGCRIFVMMALFEL
jgi:hypothetical protein